MPNRNKILLKSTASLAVLSALTGTANAQEVAQATGPIEEVVVTSTKRVTSAQSTPVTVTALSSRALDELNVDNFTDYLIELPNVTAGGSGPGQNTIYIRGVASTTPNLTVAGVAGLAPNVALYLDEQPLSQPGRNLDVYAVDLERVEVLPGPQGTLFGASSQAGTVRLITNKPVLNQFEAEANFGVSFTKSGEMSNKAEGIINIPLVEDTLAIRAVVYNDNRGGYIDNVRGTRDSSESARFREAGTVRANGVPVSLRRAGVQSASFIATLPESDFISGRVADFSRVNFLEADNQPLVEEDFNDTSYSGVRFGVLWAPSPDWSLTVQHTRQSLESEGVFFTDPELDDLEIQRFEPDDLEDDFHNTSWTLEGRLAMLDIVYTGAFTKRETEQTVDYTDYMFVGQYFTYYTCDATVTYPEYNYAYYDPVNIPQYIPVGTCQPPNAFVDSVTDTEVMTHEFRVNTPDDKRIYATVGAFYSDLTLKERNDFNYPGSLEANIFRSFGAPFDGFPPNFPFMTGFTSDPGPFPPGVIFRNDVKRTDEQLGVFGNVTYELVPNELNLTFGARWYDIDVDLEGSANASFANSFQLDVDAFGTDISDLFNGDGQFTFRNDSNPATHITFTEGQTFEEIKEALRAVDPFSIARGELLCAPNAICDAEITQILNSLSAPDKASTSGVIFKATVDWTPTDNQLYYFTFSEGFRPGLLNRPGGAPGPSGFTVPFALDTDDVTNFEFGWKTDLFRNSVRFNGNAFFVKIDRLQTTIFDPSITNLFFSDNAANAEVYGLEGDISWAPFSVPGLFVNGSFSILDTKITKVLTPTGDVRKGDELAFAPNFQSNVRARYEWQVGDGLTAHVMPQIIYTGSSFSDIITINRAKQDDYVRLDFAAGVTGDRWSVEAYVDNLNDTRGELANNFVFDRERVTVIRPRTFGLRAGFRY